MDLRTLLIILHVIGTALGVGAATVSDYLFFKFTKDGKIDKHEFRILHIVSDIVWTGLLLLLLSGFGFVLLYLGQHESALRVYSMDKIAAKITIVIILLCNGFVLHRRVLPLFEKRLGKPFATPSFIAKSPLIFSAGALSAASWYTTLILGAWRGLDASYMQIMLGYAAIVLIGMLIANIGGRSFLMSQTSKRK